MNTGSQFDFDAAVAQIIATRPRQLRGEPLSFDIVSWAITALEEFGIHPSLSTIGTVVGPGGSQRVLKPLVNRYYIERVSQSAQRAAVDSDQHLMALYDCVAGRVRKQVEENLSDELREVAEARNQLEHLRSLFERDRNEASRQLVLAESIRSEVQEELGMARSERRELQDRTESLSRRLGELQSDARDSTARIEDLGKQNAVLASKVKSADTSINKLRFELAQSIERESAAVKALRDRSEAIELLTKEANGLRLTLQLAVAKSRESEQQHSDLTKRHRNASLQLEQMRAKLARERASLASLRHELRTAKAACTEADKRAARARRDLHAMTTARDRAVAATRASDLEVQSLRRFSERLRAKSILGKGTSE